MYLGGEFAKYATAATIQEMVRRAFKRIIRRSKGRVGPLSREMAVSVGTQRVVVAFDEESNALRVTEEEERKPGKSWIITMQSDSSGDLYKVVVTRVKERAIQTLITRTQSPAQD